MTEGRKEVDLNVHALPAEWAAKKVLGPTLDEVGNDLAKLYRKGVKSLLERARSKISNLNDKKIANLRVTRDVFWNGAYSNSEAAAEYFSGVLASSRSSDGKDDSMIYYLDIIKSLSSKQLVLHYAIYRALNVLLVADSDKKSLNIGLSGNVEALKLFVYGSEIESLGINMGRDSVALYNKGLIKQYSSKSRQLDGNDFVPDSREIVEPVKIYQEAFFVPTTLGFQLYAVACAQADEWHDLARKTFTPLADVGEFENKFLNSDDILSHTQRSLKNYLP